jgi:hypothetical protein
VKGKKKGNRKPARRRRTVPLAKLMRATGPAEPMATESRRTDHYRKVGP